MKTTKEQMKQRLVEYYRTCMTGRYGTLSTIGVYEVAINEDEAKILGTLVNISTYGNKRMTYKGFSAWLDFKDENLKNQCAEAFAKNINRLHALKSF